MCGGVRVRGVYPLSPPPTHTRTIQTSSELGAGHSTELESRLNASQRQVKRLEDDLAEQKVGCRWLAACSARTQGWDVSSSPCGVEETSHCKYHSVRLLVRRLTTCVTGEGKSVVSMGATHSMHCIALRMSLTVLCQSPIALRACW